MECPSGHYATKVNAHNATDGCTSCNTGEFSSGGTAISCNTIMNCLEGQEAKPLASTNTDCKLCEIGYFSLGGDVSACTVINCSPGMVSISNEKGSTVEGCL